MRAVAVDSEPEVKLAAPSNVNRAGWASAAEANSVDDMATLVDTEHRPPAPERQRRPVPWSPRAWRQALYLAAGIPAQLAWLIVLYLVVRGFRHSGSGLGGPVALLAALFALLLLLPALTQVQRHRLRVTAGIAIAPHPKTPSWRLTSQCWPRWCRTGDSLAGPLRLSRSSSWPKPFSECCSGPPAGRA